MLRVLDTGVTSLREVFKRFDQDTSNYVSQEEFTEALQDFGFRGEGTPALTEEEIKILVQSADKDGDGTDLILDKCVPPLSLFYVLYRNDRLQRIL